MGTSKTPTATKYLENVKKAQDFMKQDGWHGNTKRMLSYLVGDYGEQMYKTRYIVNTIYNLVNLIIPNIYFQNPHIIVRPSKPYFINKDIKVDGFKRSQLVEHVLNQEIKLMNYKNEVRKVIQDCLLAGHGVMKFGRSGSTCHEDDLSYLEDGDIFGQRISIFDYFIDPMSTNPKNSRFEIYRYVDTLSSVKKNKMFSNTADLEGCSLADDSPKKDKKEKSKDSGEWLELYEYHDHERDKVIVLTKDSGNKKKMLYNEDRKYEFKGSDFEVLKFTSDSDSFFGIPALRMVEDESLAINEVLTLMVNHLQKFAGVIMYEEGALDEDDLNRFEYGQQGDLLQTQNGALREGRVRRESPLTMGGDYYNNFNLLSASIDRTLAIPDFQRSTQSGKRKTALEVNVAASDANNRRGYFISFVKDFVISSSAKITSLMQQFYDEKRWINMYGDYTEWIEWNKEDIKGEYIFDFDVEDIKAYSSSKAQATIQALQVMAPIQLFAPVWQKVDPFKLANLIFKNMDIDLKSIEKGAQIAHYEHDPYKENKLLSEGKRLVDPHHSEPHEEHIEIHKYPIQEAMEKQDKAVIDEGMRHVQMHQYWMQINQTLPGNPQQSGVPQQQNQQPNVRSSAEIEGGFDYNQDMKEEL